MPFSLTVPKKQKLMIPVYLHKGSWREFKIALALHLKGCVKYWDSHLSRKIFMILKGEEIRKRFLSALPPLSRFDKLGLSLDDIINPLEILEKKSHRKGCHPGRLTLDPVVSFRIKSESSRVAPFPVRLLFQDLYRIDDVIQ